MKQEYMISVFEKWRHHIVCSTINESQQVMVYRLKALCF